jgi:MoxR-like ATPase
LESTTEQELTEVQEIMEQIKEQLSKVIIEQEEMIELSLISLLSEGHVLVEGVPGLAKTLLVRSLSEILELDFNRVQFTSDLMPADITGTKIFNMKSREFELQKGPVFTNFLLEDEINRTPPKTQAGLLEAMEEGSVTIDGELHKLPQPYMIIATQNPLEYEGTYPLPEAMLDRFLMKIIVDYPSNEAESSILKQHDRGFSAVDLDGAKLETVCTAQDIRDCRKQVQQVKVDEALIDYMVAITAETRDNSAIEVGSSPRGSIALLRCSKARAAYHGREYIIPEDIKQMVVPILRHRIDLRAELELEQVKPKQVLEDILSKLEVPR